MKRGIRRLVRSYLRDERGSAAILAVPMIFTLLGMAAISMDMMNAFATQERLRTAAEAAATAAVTVLPDEEAALEAAILYGEKNLSDLMTGTVISEDEVEFGHWDDDSGFDPDPGADPVNAVRVTASLRQAKDNPLPTWFGGVLGVSMFDISSSAIALPAGGGIPCILALDGSGSQALTLLSNADLNLTNCEVHVRSTSSSGMYTDSNATITAARNCVAGSNHSELSNSEVTPDPEYSCEVATDPFAAVVEPTVSSTCTYNNKVVDNTPATLAPGVYCNGLQIKNNAVVTFSPGVHIIKNGKFLLDSNSRISGTGVGFYLTGSASLLEFTSNTQVNLTAASTGALKGMLFFQKRSNSGEHKFDSNTAAVLDGALYFANGTFRSDSNTAMASASSCMMLVAKRIRFDSNSGVTLNANYSLCPWMPGAGASRHTRVVG